MNACRVIPLTFILAAVTNLSARQDVVAQTPVDYGPPGPYLVEPPAVDCSQPKPVLVQPQGAWVQPAVPIQMVPIMPLPESAGPRPGTLVGPVFGSPPLGPQAGAVPGLAPPPAEAGSPLANIAPGGLVSPQFGLPAAPEATPGFANPIFVPATDDQWAWEQITDVVSDYFTITREQQVRRSGDAWSEGRIETAYQGGAIVARTVSQGFGRLRSTAGKARFRRFAARRWSA